MVEFINVALSHRDLGCRSQIVNFATRAFDVEFAADHDGRNPG